MLTFPSYVIRGSRMSQYSDEQVKNEPMFFNCSLKFALENGGPITKEFISKLQGHVLGKKWLEEGVLDSRVHMLMPGWYPCIPGWHHDDVPRSTADGQPNYKNPEYRSVHCLALVNAHVAPTEFLVGKIEVPEPERGRVIYEQWDSYLMHEKCDGGGKRIKADEDRLYFFNCDTFHRGTAAVENGWRWFGRVSINTNRKPTNEIRKQVQVYMSAINAGW